MKTIRSLKDLKAAKRELAFRKRATRKAFASHLGDFRADANHYLLKKLLIPVGVAVVGGVVWKYFLSNPPQAGQGYEEIQDQSAATRQGATAPRDQSGSNWLKYVRVILSLIKIYQRMTSGGKEAVSEEDPSFAEEQAPSPRRFVEKFREQQVQQ